MIESLLKIKMDKEEYYLKLESLMDKIKSLKRQINDSEDDEKIKYLKMALQMVNQEMRLLMETYYKN